MKGYGATQDASTLATDVTDFSWKCFFFIDTVPLAYVSAICNGTVVEGGGRLLARQILSRKLQGVVECEFGGRLTAAAPTSSKR